MEERATVASEERSELHVERSAAESVAVEREEVVRAPAHVYCEREQASAARIAHAARCPAQAKVERERRRSE